MHAMPTVIRDAFIRSPCPPCRCIYTYADVVRLMYLNYDQAEFRRCTKRYIKMYKNVIDAHVRQCTSRPDRSNWPTDHRPPNDASMPVPADGWIIVIIISSIKIKINVNVQNDACRCQITVPSGRGKKMAKDGIWQKGKKAAPGRLALACVANTIYHLMSSQIHSPYRACPCTTRFPSRLPTNIGQLSMSCRSSRLAHQDLRREQSIQCNLASRNVPCPPCHAMPYAMPCRHAMSSPD